MKTKTSFNKILISLVNLIFMLIDIFLFALVIFLILSTIVLIGAIFSNPYCYSIMENLFNVCKQTDCLNLCVALLGICLTGLLIPFISFFVSLYKSNKAIEDDIEETVARATDIEFYVVSFPMGIWHSLSCAYQLHNFGDKSIDEFNSCMHLFFKGDLFQTFILDIREIGYFDLGKRISLRNEYNFEEIKYLVSDTTGVNGIDAAGTNVSILFPEENIINQMKKNFNDKLTNKKMFLEIKFTKRVDPFHLKYKQAFRGYFFLFPLIRSLFNIVLKLKQKYNFCEIELSFNDREFIDEDHIKVKYEISDIHVKKVRRKKW